VCAAKPDFSKRSHPATGRRKLSNTVEPLLLGNGAAIPPFVRNLAYGIYLEQLSGFQDTESRRK
jgi:hypothetical protein